MTEKKVLVVDDSSMMVKMVTKIITRMGLEVESTTSSKEGMALLRKNDYDLVILDLEMPEINGVQFLKLMKANSMNVPVIILTGKYEKNYNLISQIMKEFPLVKQYEIKSHPYPILDDNLCKSVKKVLKMH